MKKAILFFILSTVLFSCKSKKNITNEIPESNDTLISEVPLTSTTTPIKEKKINATYEKVVKEHYALNKNFKTLQISADVEIKDTHLNETATADIKIEKNKAILIIVKKFGIPLARVLITPERVSYYEVLNGTHYDGDFKFLSKFLDTPLNYPQIENLLIGTALFNLDEEELTTKVEDSVYKLYKENDIFSLVFVLDGLTRIKQEVIQSKDTQDKLVIDYLSYKNENSLILPNKLLIRALHKNTTELKIDYKKITIDPEISFTYKIPNGSKAINF